MHGLTNPKFKGKISFPIAAAEVHSALVDHIFSEVLHPLASLCFQAEPVVLRA